MHSQQHSFLVQEIREGMQQRRTAQSNPEKGIACTNEGGIYQLHSWDLTNNELTQLTDSATGTLFGAVAADGQYIYYLKDQTGNELGHYLRQPINGGETEDLTPEMPPYASFSIMGRKILRLASEICLESFKSS